MAKPKTPRFKQPPEIAAWRELLDSKPYARGELALATALEWLVSEKIKGNLNSGPAALEALFALDHHLKMGHLTLEHWNEIAVSHCEEHICIPGWVFAELVDGWSEYVLGGPSVSLVQHREYAHRVSAHHSTRRRCGLAVERS